jgi:hypothetical protein
MASIAQRTPSRLSPEFLMLPQGMLSTRMLGTSPTITPSTSSVSQARLVCAGLSVNTPACLKVEVAGVGCGKCLVEIDAAFN